MCPISLLPRLLAIGLGLFYPLFGLALEGTATITTVAGGTGDGGSAAAAPLNLPQAVAVDKAGNLYIADTLNNRIRKVDSAGTITTVAGNGTFGSGDDGGPATATALNNPSGVATDGAGNLYVLESYSHRIRKVDSMGLITTVAGNGTAGFAGDGGPATAASLALYSDGGMAADGAGNLYIADTSNHRIRKVDPEGIITTVAGNGTAGFAGDGGPAIAAQLGYPSDVVVDAAGNLYLADSGRIRKINGRGIITTVAGTGMYGFAGDGGPATAASFSILGRMTIDGAGNLYFADSGNHRIRMVNRQGIISTVAGNGNDGFRGDGGPAALARLNTPYGVAVDSAGNLYIADFKNYRIRRVDPTGIITTVAGTGTVTFGGDRGPAAAAVLSKPEGVAVDSAGNLYIADTGNDRIRKVDSAGLIITVAGNGARGFGGDGGPAAAASLSNPEDVAVDPAGNLYIADSGNSRIRKVDLNGIITTVAGDGNYGYGGDGGPATAAFLSAPGGVTVDGAGNLYIADTHNVRIRKMDADGIITTVAGNGTTGYGGDGGPAITAALHYPKNVAVDPAGNLYIADSTICFPFIDAAQVCSGNDRIRKVDPAGIITTVAGNGFEGFGGDGGPAIAATLSSPYDVAVDPAGNLYIADSGNSRIRKVDPTGIITTLAGEGTAGFAGDGGPAAAAQLNGPSGLAIDGTGNLYIADTGNGRIRKVIDPASPGMAVPPIADAGPEAFDVPLGRRYRLNGAASLDPNTGAYQQPLRFLWSVIASPANARFGLANRKTAVASLVPPLPGDYIFDLQVSNDNGASHSQVTIHVIGEIRVTAPVAGEVWRLGHPQTIVWSTRGIPFTKTVSIFLENAGGKRYLLKNRVRSGKGFYLWNSRNDSRKYLSEQARIRVCLKKIGRNPPVCGESEGSVAIRE